ncbi:MAG: hypothetical protein IT260_16275 [Saprospiraceae bacterium]|nr:hypothetical protein [Saprospiraceae bacterium]
MNDAIAQLARQNNFAQLDPAQRARVLEYMSAEEFDQLRHLLLSAAQLDAGPGPSAALQARLSARMAGRPGLLSRPIPAWQAAAAVVLAVGAAAGWFKTPEAPAPAPPLVEYRTDTLYREKIVWKDRVVLREKIVLREVPAPATPAAPLVPVSAPMADRMRPEPVLSLEFAEPQQGSSLGNEPALLDFLVQIK